MAVPPKPNSGGSLPLQRLELEASAAESPQAGGYRQGSATAVPGFHITPQEALPGPDRDGPVVVFVNETTYGNRRFLRTNVLSARGKTW
jgi:hypothetical protein